MSSTAMACVESVSDGVWLALLGLTLFGLLFSIYLTMLELFVIHAVCAWCLGSAVISTLLMLLVVLPITGESIEST